MAELIPLALDYQRRLEEVVNGHLASLDAAIDIILAEAD
jgi:hypothetical protein